MLHFFYYALAFSMLANLVFIYLLIDIGRVKEFHQRAARGWYDRCNELLKKYGDPDKRPMETVSAEIMQRITYLENENAQLRSDVETGCRLIEEQTRMISGQRETVNRLVAENRKFLGRFR